MTIFYSPTTRGFYSDEFNTEIPPDAGIVSEISWQELLDAQREGKVIVPNGAGYPVAVDNVLTPEEEWKNYKLKAQALLEKSDISLLRCVEKGLTPPVALTDVRAALRRILSAADGDYTLPLPSLPYV